MGRKGKHRVIEEEQLPKKKMMISEQQLMDKSHMDKTQFIPLLSSEALYPPFMYDQTNEAALLKIVTDLNYLLYTSFKQFWTTMLYNPMLKHTLASSLSFLHRRWLNQYINSKLKEYEFQLDQNNQHSYRVIKDSQMYELTEGLNQVLLVIFHRMVSFNSQNKELSSFYKIGEQLSTKYLLDIPRLLELCQIYGETNSDIVRYIVKHFSGTFVANTFYQDLTSKALPLLFKKIEDTLRAVRNQTDKEQYGMKFTYKRMVGDKLSQGEEQLQKKTSYLFQFTSFLNIIGNIINFFPENCKDYCYFNLTVGMLIQNIFLELQVAYKAWNYQEQQKILLPILNNVLSRCVTYMKNYFERCYDVLINKSVKTSARSSYVISLERVFKDFGRRLTQNKKNPSRSLLLYKIIQKQFDFHSMLYELSKKQYEQIQIEGEAEYDFNMDYLNDIIITFDNQFKEEYINQDQPRQEQVEEETQAQLANEEDIDEPEDNNQQQKEKPEATQEEKQQEAMLEILVPKRMRSQDYYQKLYQDYNKKFYKGQYEDDYDEIADHDKRPIFYEEQSSSESQSEKEKHLITNQQYINHINALHHQRLQINRQQVRKNNANKPTFGPSNTQSGNKKYAAKDTRRQQDGPKKKYVAKNNEKIPEEDIDFEAEQSNKSGRVEYREKEGAEDEPEKKGGQGYKKSNKSYRYKPKEKQQNHDKGRNTNKQRDHDRRSK